MDKVNLNLLEINDSSPSKENGYYISIILFFLLLMVSVISPLIVKKYI